MQRVQLAGFSNRAFVRFLALLAGFGVATALLRWLTFTAADAFSFTVPARLQDFTKSSRSDDYVGNRQPEDARLVVYERFSRGVIESDTRGVDPVWNR